MLDELKIAVGFGPADAAALRVLAAQAGPGLTEIADLLKQRILRNPEARQAFDSDLRAADRLQATTLAWLQSLLSGPWDDGYYQLRRQAARAYLPIAPEHFSFTAIALVRSELLRLMESLLAGDHIQQGTASAAIVKLMDLEFAIMLNGYREDLAAQQARTERLATFGQLVGSIGHELRNPLGVIETSLFLLDSRLGEDPRASKHLARIGEQVELAKGIIGDLLDMFRGMPLTSESLAIADVIDSLLRDAELPSEVTLTVRGLGDLPPVRGDARQLRQVFSNLLQNAVAALTGKGEIHLSGHCEGSTVQLVFEDSGPGVDPRMRSRLFEPLVTTKPEGIGLGLALVKRIVERHRGSIRYSDRPTGGARFVLTFPVAKS